MHLLMVILSIWTCQMARGYSYDDLDRIMSHLLNESRYKKDIRPVQNQSSKMVVNVTFGLYELDSMDVTGGYMSMMSYFRLSWMDEYLVWNPVVYGGIDFLSVACDKIWEPGLAQKGGIKAGDSATVINEGFARSFVFPNGQVVLMTGGYYRTQCDIDTRYYPFDTHVCRFTFFSFRYPAQELTIKSKFNHIDTDIYNDHGSWDLADTEVNCAEITVQGMSISVVHYRISVRRRPMFVFVNRYCPLMFLTMLNSMTSLIPPDSGERFSFAVTMYLAFVFMTSALVDEFPQNAMHISLSSYGVLVIEIFNTASVIWTVFMVRMSRWNVDKSPIPKTLVKLVKWSRRSRKVSPNDEDTLDGKQDEWVVEDINQKQTEAEETEDNNDTKPTDDPGVTWLHVTMLLDKVYFGIMVVIVIVVMIAIIIYWIIMY